MNSETTLSDVYLSQSPECRPAALPEDLSDGTVGKLRKQSHTRPLLESSGRSYFNAGPEYTHVDRQIDIHTHPSLKLTVVGSRIFNCSTYPKTWIAFLTPVKRCHFSQKSEGAFVAIHGFKNTGTAWRRHPPQEQRWEEQSRRAAPIDFSPVSASPRFGALATLSLHEREKAERLGLCLQSSGYLSARSWAILNTVPHIKTVTWNYVKSRHLQSSTLFRKHAFHFSLFAANQNYQQRKVKIHNPEEYSSHRLCPSTFSPVSLQ